ncbi:MAG: PPC domain-containing protein, partial [Myxococcota bacterium]
LDKCSTDDECPTVAWRCVFPAQVCELRPGFGEDCASGNDCAPDAFCSLGRCRLIANARQCARRGDCPVGQACDRESFLCIEEADCTLVEAFPETACDPGEVCESFSGRCQLPCQNECSAETEATDCGFGGRCDGACRCVQCIIDDDCGPGLLCNQRAGRCESEDLCYSDDDCENPLICDPRTALCQLPPPPCETDLDCDIAEICNRTTGVCEQLGGECVDDRYENADTPLTAEVLRQATRDGAPLFLDQLQLCPNDDDVYAVSLEAGDNLVARIAETRAQAKATLWLLDPEGETSLRFAMAPPFGDGTISYVAQSPETVYLRVSALTAQSPYSMEVTIWPGEACAPDLFEGLARNDTLASATLASLVPTGVTIAGTICPGDRDFLQVDLAAGEGLAAELSFDGGRSDLDLRLYDAANGALLKASAGIISPESLRYRTYLPRTVIVAIEPFGPSDGAWQLSLERLVPFTCTPDAAEPDNSLEQAARLPPADILAGQDRTLCTDDADFMAVPLLDFERLVAVASYDTDEFDLELRVVSDSGDVLRSAPLGNGARVVTYDAATAGDVWLEVRPRLGGQGRYRLDVYRELQQSCAPDHLEPNDTSNTATAVPDDVSLLTVCGTDQDWFVVDGEAGKLLHARIAFLNADGDLDLMIVGTDGNQILAASDGIGNEEQTSAVLPIDGQYFVRVFALNSGARARYSLEISLSNP